MTHASVFAAVFVALFVAHSVGDHWVQTSVQSAAKGRPGWVGRLAGARHVTTLTAPNWPCSSPPRCCWVCTCRCGVSWWGLSVDAATHWWADRRSTLAWLAKVTGKAEFYSLGTGAHPAHPVTATGGPAAHLGTGAYALDQSFHHLWLLVAALLITLI